MPVHYLSQTLRLLALEKKAFEETARAYTTGGTKLKVGHLICTAALEECCALGLRTSTFPTAQLQCPAMPWPWAPARPEGGLGSGTVPRITITVSPLYYPLFEIAARAHDLPLPAFLIGSGIRWIALRKAAEPKVLRHVVLPDYAKQISMFQAEGAP